MTIRKLQRNAYEGFSEVAQFEYSQFYAFLFDFHMWLVDSLLKYNEVYAYEVEQIVKSLLEKYRVK